MPDDPSKTPWKFAGFMENGRWYPSAVPLMDGRLVIVGGFVGFKDITTLDQKESKRPWRYVEVNETKGSPFATDLEDLTEAAKLCNQEPGGQKQCDAYKKDAFKLYPRAVLLPDGERIFFTRDDDYNSLREATGMFRRNTKNSYIINIGNPDDITFEKGPVLPRYALNSGTVVRNPKNPKQILVTGGMPNYGGNLGPSLLNASDPKCDIDSDEFDINLANHYLGSRGSQGLLTYNMPLDTSGVGTWEKWNSTFLGITPDDDRTMHYMIILPTEELLVVGGGNYDFAHGVRTRAIWTPVRNDPTQYQSKRVSDMYHERLYHSTALLLGDGRVFMGGGNPNRASILSDEPLARERLPSEGPGQKKFNLDHVDRQVYFFGDGVMGKGFKPSPAEDWTAGIYSPPYLFIDGDRRTVIESLENLSQSPNGFEFNTEISGKMHYLLQSSMKIRMTLSNYPPKNDCGIADREKTSIVLIKLAASTHGWDSGQQLFRFTGFAESSEVEGAIDFITPDSGREQIIPGFYHLIYNDCHGKPTVSVSVRFDDNVSSIKDVASPPA